jgi:AAA family ATP:ADP antiporter
MATYVITRPAREVLFTVVSREEKYKAKVGMPVASDSLGIQYNSF